MTGKESARKRTANGKKNGKKVGKANSPGVSGKEYNRIYLRGYGAGKRKGKKALTEARITAHAEGVEWAKGMIRESLGIPSQVED